MSIHGCGNLQREIGVAKLDTARELDTTRHEINRLWVEI